MKMTKKYDDLNDAFDVSNDIVQPEVVEKKIDKTVGNTRLVLKEKIGIVIFLFMLISIEWFLRRRLGLL